MRDKRTEVVRSIKRAARVRGMDFVPRRAGGNHTIYDLDGMSIPIPNGTTVNGREHIFRQCQDKLGKGWWR